MVNTTGKAIQHIFHGIVLQDLNFGAAGIQRYIGKRTFKTKNFVLLPNWCQLF